MKHAEIVEIQTPNCSDWPNSRRLLEPIGWIPPAEFEAEYYRTLNPEQAELVRSYRSLRNTQGDSVEVVGGDLRYPERHRLIVLGAALPDPLPAGKARGKWDARNSLPASSKLRPVYARSLARISRCRKPTRRPKKAPS
jgi:hypothetical protein